MAGLGEALVDGGLKLGRVDLALAQPLGQGGEAGVGEPLGQAGDSGLGVGGAGAVSAARASRAPPANGHVLSWTPRRMKGPP